MVHDCLANILEDFGINMQVISNAADVFANHGIQQLVPKPILKFNADPIALAFGSYRIWLENPGCRWTELDTITPTDDDHAQAQALRDYYRGKLTFNALKHGTPLTEFKRKLHVLISGTLDITANEVGILYRLPYFYAEDLAHDEVFAAVKIPSQTAHAYASWYEGEFKLLKRVLRSRAAGGDYIQFWFTSNISSAAFQLTVKADNSLIGFAESVFKQPTFNLGANMFLKSLKGQSDRRYYAMGGVKLI